MSNSSLLNFVILDSTEVAVESEALTGVANVSCLALKNRDASDIDDDSGDEKRQRLREADAVGVWHTVDISKDFLDNYTSSTLRLIVRFGAGYCNVDLAECTRRRIAVCNCPSYGTEEVADAALAHILNMYRSVAYLAAELTSNGRVIAGPDSIAAAAAEPYSGGARRIRGQVLGIVGLGRIGSAVALRAKAFGFVVVAYDPLLPLGWEKSLGVERAAGLPELLRRADCVTLHANATPENRRMIDGDALRLMKPGALLVNTARGELVDEAALRRALLEGRLAGAALDVHEREPFDAAEWADVLATRRLLVTPHSAWYSRESRIEMRQQASGHVRALAQGVKFGEFLAQVNGR